MFHGSIRGRQVTGTSIIVVEDERIVALHLKQQLSKLGYHVAAVVASSNEALHKISEVRPDLVLMDIHIEGDIDGIETTMRIPAEYRIPVIYLSAYSEEATLERARSSKPYGFLVKPFSERELHVSIEMALERSRLDSALQSSQDQAQRERDTAQRYLDLAGVMLLALDAAGNVTLINRRGCATLGHDDSSGIIGKPWIDTFIPPSRREELKKSFADLFARKMSVVEFYTNPVLTKQGEERLIAWHNSVLTDDEGRITATLSSGEDITERKLAEDNLRLSEERFRSIFGAVSEGIFITDSTSGTILEVNAPGAAMFGYEPCELERMTIQQLSSGLPPYTQKEAAELIAQAATSRKPQRFNWHCKRKDGLLFWAEISMRFDSITNRDVVLAVLRDIDERLAVEAQLRQSQKMEAIGQLTGGIAHDFNNLLAIIHGNLELIREQSSDRTEVAEMAGDALRAASRGASLTHQLLAYSRRAPLSPQVVRLDAIVANLARLLKRTLAATIAVKTSVPADLWATRIDPNQIENVLLNLSVNARDAMPDGGTLTIACANFLLDEHWAEQNSEFAAGSYVRLDITDSGTGMPKEILDRVLEPFFTTKPVGQGTGLGLSMVYGFVKQSGGHLKIYSEIGHGTTVSLFLPRAEAGSEDVKPLRSTNTIPIAIDGEVILVVEDDELVRKYALRVLSALGYRTLQAEDGPGALRVLQEAPRIDLLLTDVVLPLGMKGPAIARIARLSNPSLGVLYMSGYADGAGADEDVRHDSAQFLAKPFPRAELGRKVRDILDRRVSP
jgi:PAS domain S-box-containing protein